jgi:hypothetical protein
MRALKETGVNEIVVLSVGSRSAVSIPRDENFILAKNLPLGGPNPGCSLFSIEELLGRSPPGEVFWPSRIAGYQPASGAQIGFWVFWLFSERWGGVPQLELAAQSARRWAALLEHPNGVASGQGFGASP